MVPSNWEVPREHLVQQVAAADASKDELLLFFCPNWLPLAPAASLHRLPLLVCVSERERQKSCKIRSLLLVV